MNLLSFNSPLRSLLSLAMLSVSSMGLYAFNSVYNGTDVIFDQPEGELRYYDVHVEGLENPYSSTNKSYKTFEYDIVVPFVFSDDGKVYCKNIFGKGTQYAPKPVWMQGTYKDGVVNFNISSLYSFYVISVFAESGNPLNYMIPVKYSIESNKLIFNEDPSVSAIDFIQKEDGGLKSVFDDESAIQISSYSIVTSCELTPSSSNFVTPPEGYAVEDYQINFKSFAMACLNNSQTASLRLKAVRTEDEIYLKGLSVIPNGNPDAWIKGEIAGNRVIFRKALEFGVGNNSSPMYLTPMRRGHDYDDDYFRVGGFHSTITYIPTGEDLIFDYDPESGRLSNPNDAFGFTSSPDATWSQTFGTEDFNIAYVAIHDFFEDAEIFKIPEDIVFEPKGVSIIERNSSYIRYSMSYLDKNGYMMDPYKLYIKIVNKNETLNQRYINFENWMYEEGPLKPCGAYYFGNLECVEGIGFDINVWQDYYYYFDGSLPASNISVSLVYRNDSPETGIEDVSNLETEETQPLVYDLFGRRVNPDSLKPGIYIINGKKTAITR